MTSLDALNNFLRRRNARYRDGNNIVEVRYEAVSVNDDTITYMESWSRVPVDAAEDQEPLPEDLYPFRWFIPPPSS